jgi:hypothetical protein
MQNTAILTDDACSDCTLVCGFVITLITCTPADVLLAAAVCGLTAIVTAESEALSAV